ncbi:MAG: hypothetical protein ACQEW9_14685 [Bacteroidota bacterium]
MKPAFYLSSLFLILSLLSCSESENPRSPLIGTWENRTYVDSLDYWFVESYTFKNDSIFDLKTTVRDLEAGTDLGYRMTSTAWYNLEGDVFQYYYSDALIYFAFRPDDPLFVPKEDLRAVVIDFFRVPKGKLSFTDDLRQFTFQEDCITINPDADCLQFPPRTFVRVD